jgi:hypothetical protein
VSVGICDFFGWIVRTEECFLKSILMIMCYHPFLKKGSLQLSGGPGAFPSGIGGGGAAFGGANALPGGCFRATSGGVHGASRGVGLRFRGGSGLTATFGGVLPPQKHRGRPP